MVEVGFEQAGSVIFGKLSSQDIMGAPFHCSGLSIDISEV